MSKSNRTDQASSGIRHNKIIAKLLLDDAPAPVAIRVVEGRDALQDIAAHNNIARCTLDGTRLGDVSTVFIG